VASLSLSDLPALNSAKIWVGDGSNVAAPVSVSGDGTMDNVGVLSIASVGTSSAANIHSAELAANAATAANTASKIVARDGSGNFAANLMTGRGIVYNDTQGTPNSVTLQAPNTVTTSYTLKFPAAQGGATTGRLVCKIHTTCGPPYCPDGESKITVTSSNSRIHRSTESVSPLAMPRMGSQSFFGVMGHSFHYLDGEC
jgi:hypothetical protein